MVVVPRRAHDAGLSACSESGLSICRPPRRNSGHTHSLVIKTSTDMSTVFSECPEKRQDPFSGDLFCNFEVISIPDNNSNCTL